MLHAKTISVSIGRPWQEVYETLWRPEAFARWASGLSAAALHPDGDSWVGQGPDGPIRVRFTAHNALGVMDHAVDIGEGRIVHVPMRVIANGEGCEVLLTLFRQPEMTEEKYAQDEAWVRRDLAALKALAEG
jgi:hypothetical protein